ncbi:MAG TPA: GWxTD domain-containing protein [Acidobacteriota bacterium]|nr:GWxTD domain-containing protein [Acidobacteriota bacterium]
MRTLGAIGLVLLLAAGCGGVNQFVGERTPLTDRQKDAAMKALLGPVEFSEYVLITDTIEATAWLRRFWIRHDPTPTTPENEFRDEHEERIYHAIYLFDNSGLGGGPWDDRGEVYIRYGRPDERLIRHSGIDDDDLAAGSSESDRMFGRDFGTLRNGRGSATEVWTYYRWNETFQFEDRRGTGSFEMVPVTELFSEREDVAEFYASRLTALDLQPAIYYHEYGKNLIDYALDVVRFRADSGRWNVDVNLGYPLSELSRGPDSNWISVRRTLIVRDGNEDEVYSEGGRIRRLVGPASSHRLMVEQKILNLEPGRYTLAVTIEDMHSGKTGTYVKTFRLPRYIVPEVQEISDIEMASYVWTIFEPGSPFVKGDRMVVPLPTRVYLPGQPVAFYYEVYNMLLGKDGCTRYATSYTITQADGRVPDSFKPLPSEEWTSDTRDVARIGTLDVDDLPSGEYFLTVTVDDQIGHHQKVTVARFRKSN